MSIDNDDDEGDVKVILQRIHRIEVTEQILSEAQAAFRAERSTIGQPFTVRRLSEKYAKFRIYSMFVYRFHVPNTAGEAPIHSSMLKVDLMEDQRKRGSTISRMTLVDGTRSTKDGVTARKLYRTWAVNARRFNLRRRGLQPVHNLVKMRNEFQSRKTVQ